MVGVAVMLYVILQAEIPTLGYGEGRIAGLPAIALIPEMAGLGPPLILRSLIGS